MFTICMWVIGIIWFIGAVLLSWGLMELIRVDVDEDAPRYNHFHYEDFKVICFSIVWPISIPLVILIDYIKNE